MRLKQITACAVLLAFAGSLSPADAQVRGARRRTTVVQGEEGKGAVVGRNGVAVKGEEGYAAAGRNGAVVSGNEGYAAVGRHGAVVKGEEGYAAVGRRGAIVAGEEGYVATGRHGGVVVGQRYESYEGWKIAAGVATGIAIGTMLARPPRAAVTVSYGGSSYWYDGGVYYTRVMSGGSMVYQVVSPPTGIIVAGLPAACTSVRVGAVTYSQCNGTYYQRVGTGYQVVVLR